MFHRNDNQATTRRMVRAAVVKRVRGIETSFAQWDGKSALCSGIGSGYSNFLSQIVEYGESEGGRHRL